MLDLRSLLQAYLTPPAHFKRHMRSFFTTISLTWPLGTLLHVVYIPLFLWMGVPVMAAYNVFSVIAWILALLLVRRGHVEIPLCICIVEVLGHAALCARLVGWGFGFQYYLFAGMAASGVFPAKLWLRLPCSILFAGEFAILSLDAGKAIWPGDPAVLAALNIFNIAAASVVFTLMSLYYTALAQRAEAALEAAHAQSESLLLNILPDVIASRLKQSSATIADGFASASIFFTDIVNFTPFSQSMAPTQVVELLDDLFSRFDELVRKHSLEKIKTIGDAYMVAAGIPVRRDDHAEALAEFALDLRQVLAAYNAEKDLHLQVRMGINSGPVVAGVIGKLRFLYDLWGDSVNTASRMESHGVPDEIQVTEETYHLLADKYVFEERGVIDVKGKGPMRTYFLRGRKMVEDLPQDRALSQAPAS